MPQLIVAPTTTAVSVAEVCNHLRLPASLSSDDTPYLTLLISACTDAVQAFTNRQVCPATYDLLLDAFPSGAVDLPLPPLIEVLGVFYIGTDGAEHELAAFSVDAVAGRVMPEFGASWPATRDVPNAVRIRFRAGYSDVPNAIKSALLLGVGDLYGNREAQQDVALHRNKAFENLLWPYRVF